MAANERLDNLREVMQNIEGRVSDVEDRIEGHIKVWHGEEHIDDVLRKRLWKCEVAVEDHDAHLGGIERRLEDLTILDRRLTELSVRVNELEWGGDEESEETIDAAPPCYPVDSFRFRDLSQDVVDTAVHQAGMRIKLKQAEGEMACLRAEIVQLNAEVGRLRANERYWRW